MKIRLTAALGLSAALLLSACAANEGTTTPDTTDSAAATADSSAASTLEGTLAGKGSSAMNSAQTTWIAKFQDGQPRRDRQLRTRRLRRRPRGLHGRRRGLRRL